MGCLRTNFQGANMIKEDSLWTKASLKAVGPGILAFKVQIKPYLPLLFM